MLSWALREVRVPCAESGCILWIWGAAHRVGVLRAVEVDLQSQGAFYGFGVQCTELGCSMRLGRLAESGCILWVWGAACSVGVHSADSRRNVQSWDALAELRCSVQLSAGYSWAGFWKTPLALGQELQRQTGCRSRATVGTMAGGGSASRPVRGRRACLGPLSTPFPAKQREQRPGECELTAQHGGCHTSRRLSWVVCCALGIA